MVVSQNPYNNIEEKASGNTRRLTNDPNLMLVEAPVLAPCEIAFDDEHRKMIELETQQAAEMALPEEDDEF